uniref:Nucleoprotein n=4 Tax=unclassified Rhabdoviridae TaxID=35303 RepID=A0AAU8BFQ0_9RHAB
MSQLNAVQMSKSMISSVFAGQTYLRSLRPSQLTAEPFTEKARKECTIINIPYIRDFRGAVILYCIEYMMARANKMSPEFFKYPIVFGMQCTCAHTEKDRELIFTRQFLDGQVITDPAVETIVMKLSAMAKLVKGAPPIYLSNEEIKSASGVGTLGEEKAWKELTPATEIRNAIKDWLTKGPDISFDSLARSLLAIVSPGGLGQELQDTILEILRGFNQEETAATRFERWARVSQTSSFQAIQEEDRVLLRAMSTMSEKSMFAWTEMQCMMQIRAGSKSQQAIIDMGKRGKEVTERLYKSESLGVTSFSITSAIYEGLKNEYSSGSLTLTSAIMMHINLKIAAANPDVIKRLEAKDSFDPLLAARQFGYGLALEYNGLKLFGLLHNICRKYNISPADFITDSWCKRTKDSILAMVEFLNRIDTMGVGWQWCRALHPKFEAQLSDKNHPVMAYYMACMLADNEQPVTGGTGIWESYVPALDEGTKKAMWGLASIAKRELTNYFDPANLEEDDGRYNKRLFEEHSKRGDVYKTAFQGL